MITDLQTTQKDVFSPSLPPPDYLDSVCSSTLPSTAQKHFVPEAR